MQFRINPAAKGATISVLFSTGDYPAVTLKTLDPGIKIAADSMRKSLAAAGFKSNRTEAVWRDHMLNLIYAELWSRKFKPGEKARVTGQNLDYVTIVNKIP